MDYEQQPDEQEVTNADEFEALSPSDELIFIQPPVTAVKLDELSLDQLRQYATQNGIDLGGARTATKIARAILDALTPPVVIEERDAPAAPSFDLSGLYEHMPDGFQEALTQALNARGLVGPGDYFQMGAADRFRSAMLSVIKHDFLSAQALAKTDWIAQAEGKAGAK